MSEHCFSLGRPFFKLKIELTNFPSFLKSHIIPGGYIEQVEFGVTPIFHESTPERSSCFERCSKLADDSTRIIKKSFHIADTLKQSVIEAGFVDVVETIYYIPLGTWRPEPEWKEIGRWYRNFWEAGMEGWWMASATRHLGVNITPFFRVVTSNSTTLTEAGPTTVVSRKREKACR